MSGPSGRLGGGKDATMSVKSEWTDGGEGESVLSLDEVMNRRSLNREVKGTITVGVVRV